MFSRCKSTLVMAGTLAALTHAQVMEGRDFFLSSPYALKAAVPLLLIPAAINEPDMLPFEIALLGALTFPNAMTLGNLYGGDAEGTRRWRKTVFWCDAALATAAAGMGTYLIASSRLGKSSAAKDEDAVAGAFLLGLYAVPLTGFSLLDRLPFHMESPRSNASGLNLGIGPPATGQGDSHPSLLVTSDWFLSTPYALKAVLPLFLLPEAIMDGDAIPITAALLAGVSVPNFMLLRNLYSGDAAGTRKWRKTVFWCEIGMATAFAGYGAYLIASSRNNDEDAGYDPVIGIAMISFFSLPLYGLAMLDRIPFDLEERPAKLSFGLGLPPPGTGSNSPALTLRLQIPI